MLEELDVDVYIPKVCVVETAAVTKRLSDRNLAIKISKVFSILTRLSMKLSCSIPHGESL